MIEAVTAAVSNAQMVRAVADQTATTQSFASNPTRVQTAAVTAPYLSPHVDLNGGSSKPIFVVRDSETGDFVRQFPTEGQIKAYQRAQNAQAQAEAQMLQDAAFVKSQQAHAQAQVQQKSQDIVENSVQFRQQRQEVKSQQRQSTPGSSSGGDTGGLQPGATKVQSGSSLDTEV